MLRVRIMAVRGYTGEAMTLTGTLAAVIEGVAYSSGLTANNSVGAVTWTISVGTLPAGLTINASTGLVTGTPTAAGTSNITIRAEDSIGQVATSAQVLEVVAITYIDSTQAVLVADGVTTSLAINKPIGVVSGNLLLFFVYSPNHGASVVSTPAGVSTEFAETGGYPSNVVIYSKIAGGSEPGTYTFEFSSGFSSYTVLCAAYSGASVVEHATALTRNIPDVTPTQITANSFSPASGGTLIAYYVDEVTSDARTISAAPGGMTEREHVNSYGRHSSLFDQSGVAAGATGDKTVTYSADMSTGKSGLLLVLS